MTKFKVLCIIFVANCPNIPNIYYSKKELKYFGLEILVIHEILEHIVLNIFKYIFLYICIKLKKEKKFNYSQIFLDYIKYDKDFNTLKSYTLKSLLSKKRFFFFSSSDTHKFHHLLRCHTTGVNYSFISFLDFLHFSNLLCQANKAVLTREKIKGNKLEKKYF